MLQNIQWYESRLVSNSSRLNLNPRHLAISPKQGLWTCPTTHLMLNTSYAITFLKIQTYSILNNSLEKKNQLSGSDKLEGLSSSAMLAEAKDSVESVEDRDETVSESETTSSWTMIWSSSVSDASDPDAPSRNLCIADFAVSTNHSSSGSALIIYHEKWSVLKFKNTIQMRTRNGR